jgi:hypothetical protein
VSVPNAYASNAVRGTAFHEAGNAVVARYLGKRLSSSKFAKTAVAKPKLSAPPMTCLSSTG